MSKKDGKATQLGATVKKDIHLLPIPESLQQETQQTAGACPAQIIQVV